MCAAACRAATAARAKGVILGLAVVRAILDAPGSIVRVERREGQGTRVTFDLPAAVRTEVPSGA